MTNSTSLVTINQNQSEDDFADVFTDLAPIDPFDLKKDFLGAQMAALVSFSGKSRTDLVGELGWKKSRVSNVLSGKCNLTIKSIWEFSSYLGFEFDVIFRRPSELPPRQPWQIRWSASLPMAGRRFSDQLSQIASPFEIQSAGEVAIDLLAGKKKKFYISSTSTEGALPFRTLGTVPQTNMGTLLQTNRTTTNVIEMHLTRQEINP